jgi:hypothetical protein
VYLAAARLAAGRPLDEGALASDCESAPRRSARLVSTPSRRPLCSCPARGRRPGRPLGHDLHAGQLRRGPCAPDAAVVDRAGNVGVDPFKKQWAATLAEPVN